MHVETRYFLIFRNILGIKNFWNRTNFFSGSPKYYFLGTFNETFLTLSSLACNIFSKNSWFLFLDKFQVQKIVDVITCFFCTVKKQNLRSIQAHSWTPLPLLPLPFPVLYFTKCLVSVLLIYTISISIIFVFHRKSLVLLHIMNRYTTLQLSIFLKENTLRIVNFWYQWIIHCNTDSCCEYMPGDVNIYLYGCVSLLSPECAGYLSVYVCKTHVKVVPVLRYQGLTWIRNIINWNYPSNVARSPT